MKVVIKRRNFKEYFNKVIFIFLLIGRKEINWLMVDDIISLIFGGEKGNR